jgi:hypothetical protein
VVKAGTSLSLFVDGQRRGQATVPLYLQTKARDVALGGNPHFSGNEFLAARFAQFTILSRALNPDEVKASAAEIPK